MRRKGLYNTLGLPEHLGQQRWSHTYRSSSMAELTVGYISGIIAAAVFVGWFLLTIAHDILREFS
jgi:hypothetical protein